MQNEGCGRIHVLDAELTVVKSDTAVSAELCGALRAGVRPLEDVPEQEKDWHPGTDGKVLDLVHPSLFPLVYGVTRQLPKGEVVLPRERAAEFIGKGTVVPVTSSRNSRGAQTGNRSRQARINPAFFGDFQWLPSDVELLPPKPDGTPGGARIVSYINNLHPVDHRELYDVLEHFVDAAVPLWEDCLSYQFDHRRIVVESSGREDWKLRPGANFRRDRRQQQQQQQEEEEEDQSSADNGPVDDVMVDTVEGDGNGDDSDWEDESSSEDEEMSDEDDEEYDEWWRANRILRYPEPGRFVPLTSRSAPDDGSPEDLVRQDFRSQFPKGLQVIFKLANIHLTPEKPEYEGGTWHIEGTLNENICATALYYYDEVNVTPSRLAFRQPIDTEELIMIPAQDEYESLEIFMDVRQDGPAIMELGSVLTRQGRMLAFPNILQHRVCPFRLADPTKPGHRKILAMFLVDPHIRIPSTLTCPPQRRDWWAAELLRGEAAAKKPSPLSLSEETSSSKPQTKPQDKLGKLPPELFDKVINMVDSFPLSWDNAVEIRKRLMAERSIKDEEIEAQFMEVCVPMLLKIQGSFI